eukprot:6214839-Pleurochrysis_carterae.AAC.4
MELEFGGFSPRTSGHVCRVGLIACGAAPVACSVFPPSAEIITLCLCDVMIDEMCEYSLGVAMQLHSCGHRSDLQILHPLGPFIWTIHPLGIREEPYTHRKI